MEILVAVLIAVIVLAFSTMMYVWFSLPFFRRAKPKENLALDVSLEKARALHRVWRALNDGDCPKCHTYHPAVEIVRDNEKLICPTCGFYVAESEIMEIEKQFAPAMDGAVKIFEDWRNERILASVLMLMFSLTRS